MDITTLLISAAIGTVWLFIVIGGVLGWTLLSRKTTATSRSKQRHKQKASKSESTVGEKQFGTNLIARIWKGRAGGVFKAGLTLPIPTTRGYRHTLCVKHCLDIPAALLYFCDVVEKQSWLLDEDREQLPLLRAAALAAEEVVLEANQESRQVNGRAPLNSNAPA